MCFQKLSFLCYLEACMHGLVRKVEGLLLMWLKMVQESSAQLALGAAFGLVAPPEQVMIKTCLPNFHFWSANLNEHNNNTLWSKLVIWDPSALLLVEQGLNFVKMFQVDVEIATHITISDDGPDRRWCLVETWNSHYQYNNNIIVNEFELCFLQFAVCGDSRSTWITGGSCKDYYWH